jgi:hypothetical protein
MKRPWPIYVLAVLYGLSALTGMTNLFWITRGLPIGGLPIPRAFWIGLEIFFIVLHASLAYGLWKLRNWARLTAIIFTVLSALAMGAAIEWVTIVGNGYRFPPLSTVAAVAIVMAIAGSIVWYLSKNTTKQYFSAS